MIEFKNKEEIITFDGQVISRYKHSGASLSFHIDFVESLEILTDRKGRHHRLHINLKSVSVHSDVRSMLDPQLSPEEIPAAQAFIDEVMRVIAS